MKKGAGHIGEGSIGSRVIVLKGKKTVRVDHQTVLIVDEDKLDDDVIATFNATHVKRSLCLCRLLDENSTFFI